MKWKKFLYNCKTELAKNAEYDSGWRAECEKLYFRPTNNQFFRSKFFCQKLRWKKISVKLRDRIG